MTDIDQRIPKKAKTESQATTNPDYGLICLEAGNPIPQFNGLSITHPRTGSLSKVCGYFAIKGLACKYPKTCNKVHITRSASIKDQKQRTAFIKYVNEHKHIKFIRDSDKISDGA